MSGQVHKAHMYTKCNAKFHHLIKYSDTIWSETFYLLRKQKQTVFFFKWEIEFTYPHCYAFHSVNLRPDGDPFKGPDP